MPLRAVLVSSFAAVVLGQDPPPPGTPGAPQQAPEPMLMPQVLVLPRAERELKVDGSLIDWPELPAIRLDDRRQLSGTALGAWRGPNDLGAAAFMLWDEEALWFGCAVKDEWHRALDANTLLVTEIPAADSVMLTFDPARDTRSNGADPGRREDREFWLAEERGREVVQWDRLRGSARVLDGAVARMVVLHDKERGITTYEARIPWREILPASQQPAVGTVLDLQIVVNDFDEATDSMPQTRTGLTFGVSPVVDPGLFASMMLVGDAAPLSGVVPEFPPKPGLGEPPVPPAEYWQQLTAALIQQPPVRFDGSRAAAETLGAKRLGTLEQIDEQVERFPRVDFLEFHQRIHRRMAREIAGIVGRGLPWWWQRQLESVAKNAADPVPVGSLRVFKLPMGGWLFRSPQKNFAVDAAGADLAHHLWGGIEFCVLTQPMDIVRRNDQLLVRMFLAEPPRPMMTHIAFHLPAVPMDKMILTEPGKSYGQKSGVMVHALGKTLDDGSVTWSCSYRIELPGGPNVLVVGANLRPDEVEAWPIDLMLLSPRNGDAPAIVRKVAPRLVILDEAFVCQSRPDTPRIPLRDFLAMQAHLLPTPSVVLAPGESWTVEKPK
jgi:hypothetical protein